MATATAKHGSVMATEAEQPELARLAALLREQDAGALALVGLAGDPTPLPTSVADALRQIVHLLAHTRAVTILPADAQLTTQQAADLLNVSRPYLIRLLDQGAIPYTRTGAHRRIRPADVLAYQQRRDAEQGEALDALTRMSQEFGLYARR
jgi:excisionase family DNA binding protein